MLAVSLFVSFAFAFPIVYVGGRRDPSMSTAVHMPKAAVNKNDLPARNEYKIRLSRQRPAMERVTIPHGMS